MIKVTLSKESADAVEEAFAKCGITIDGAAALDWIDTQVGNEGVEGACTLEETLYTPAGKNHVWYHINVSFPRDSDGDYTTDISLTQIEVDGEPLL